MADLARRARDHGLTLDQLVGSTGRLRHILAAVLRDEDGLTDTSVVRTDANLVPILLPTEVVSADLS
jgi:hypothetical protein